MLQVNESFQTFSDNCAYKIFGDCEDCRERTCKRIFQKPNLTERVKSFRNRVNSYASEYPQRMLEDFIDYWSEVSDNGKKMKFEKQKTWNLSLRLKRWKRNDFNKYSNDKPNIFQDEDRIERINNSLKQSGKIK